jgi:hypothetical protein
MTVHKPQHKRSVKRRKRRPTLLTDLQIQDSKICCEVSTSYFQYLLTITAENLDLPTNNALRDSMQHIPVCNWYIPLCSAILNE